MELWLRFRQAEGLNSVFKRRHPHEKNYRNDPVRNRSYQRTAKSTARKLNLFLKGENVLVYAPLRGALPIWLAVCRYLEGFDWEVYLPVSSSFVFYPREFNTKDKKCRTASGRTTHILELTRLLPFLKNFSSFLYIDEIVSGGMMTGYLKDMILLGVPKKSEWSQPDWLIISVHDQFKKDSTSITWFERAQ